MVVFVAEWSTYRWALRWSEQWGLDAKQLLGRECASRLDAFAKGGELPPRRSLLDVDAAGRRLTASLFAAYRNQYQRRTEGRLGKIVHWIGLRWLIDRLPRWHSPRHAEPMTDPDEDANVLDADSDHPTLWRGVPATWPGVDLQYLCNGFAWVEIALTEQPVPDVAVSALRDLLAVSLRTVPPPRRNRGGQSIRFPTKFDQWLYERIAGAVLRLEKQGRADDLWRPILSLGVSRGYWLKYFLSDCFRAGSAQDVAPEEFVALWTRMIRYALDEPGWDASGGSRSDAADVVNELLGFEMGKAVFGGDSRYARPIAAISPLFEIAARRWFVYPKVAAGFCRFALKPAGAELLYQGIRWLAAAEPVWSEWSWDHERVAEGLVDVLRAALDRHRGAIAANADSRDAFFHLCNQLVARGHHAALALRERVATPPGEETSA